MAKEDLWSTDDPERLLKLARIIEANGGWKGFLNKDEHKLFQSAVQQGGRVWDQFITGKAVVQVDRYHVVQSTPVNAVISTLGKQEKNRSQSINGSNGIVRPSLIRNEITPDESVLHDEVSDSPSSRAGSVQPNQKPKEELTTVTLDCISISFRVRYMLYEKALPVLFPDLHNEYDLDSIIDDDKTDEETQKDQEILSGTAAREIEDDYDEEEEEEENKNDNDEDVTMENNEPTTPDVQMEEDEAGKPILMKISIHDNDYEDETKAKEIVINNYNKMYHIFEHDRENALRQRRLDESDRQIDSDIFDENVPISGSRKTPSGASFGAANLSLKHLLATIETKRDSLSMSDSELKNLIFDVRKNRSKWASEDKIGQEELYEAAEKVVLELRGYTEHSTAFLNKVSKRDAPNYFNVIKHPMDLNTVMKKLKSLQYKSKKEFVSDLMLIWKNCLTYNTDPRHFLRAHAIAMQKKTLSLISLIPEITIRDRAEVEAEEAKAAQEDGEEDTDNVGAQRSVMGKSSKKHAAKGRKRKLDDVGDTEDAPAEESQEPTNKTQESVINTPALANPTLANIAASGTPRGSPTPGTPHSPIVGTEYDMDSALLDTDETPEEETQKSMDFETSVWQELFTKRRAEYCCKRGDLFRKNQLQKDAEAIVRKSMAMGRFYDVISHSFHPSDEFGRLKRERFFQSRDLLEALDSEKRQFILEYEVGSGLPADPPMAYDALEVLHDEGGTAFSVRNPNYQSEMDQITDVEPSNYITHGGIAKDYDNNLQTIQEIRKICSKLSLVRQMQQQQFMHTIQPYGPEKIVEKDLDIESRLPDRDKYDGPASLQAIKRSVSKIAMHNGFEVTELMAVDALAEIASDYLSNLGKLLVMTFESPNSAAMSTEEKVILTLQERGIESLSSLDMFVREDIQRYSNRLQDLKKNLTSFLTDLLRPSVQDITDNQLADGSDLFLNGDFSQQIGDDFFGFKELGLDKELGVLGAAVPFHLLQSRLSSNMNSQSNMPVNKEFETEIPDYPPINRAKAKNEIGLLRSFFISRLEISSLTTEVPNPDGEGTELVLVESDKLPPKQRNVRPKIPPTGKIVGVKKKPLSKCFFLSPEKKESTSTTTEKLTDDNFLEGLESSINAFEDSGIDKSVDSLF